MPAPIKNLGICARVGKSLGRRNEAAQTGGGFYESLAAARPSASHRCHRQLAVEAAIVA